jgi:hypothetical protein
LVDETRSRRLLVVTGRDIADRWLGGVLDCRDGLLFEFMLTGVTAAVVASLGKAVAAAGTAAPKSGNDDGCATPEEHRFQ